MKRCSLFITGAKTEEVALMNGLTVNLHLLMVRDKHLCQHSEEENTTRRKTDVKKDSKWQFVSLFCSFPSTNQRQLATKSSWKTKPFLQTTWVNLHMFEQTHKTVSIKPFLYCWNSWATNPLFTSWLSCCCTLTPAQIKSVNLKGHRMFKAGGPTQKQQMNMTPVFSPVLSTPSSLRSSCEDSTLRRACCCWKPDRYRSKQFTHSLVVFLWASISIRANIVPYKALREESEDFF